jgi:hypothetical protein
MADKMELGQAEAPGQAQPRPQQTTQQIIDVYQNLLKNLLNEMLDIESFLEHRSFSDTLRILLLIHILIDKINERRPEATVLIRPRIIEILTIIYQLENFYTTDNSEFLSSLQSDIFSLSFDNSTLPITEDPNLMFDYNDGDPDDARRKQILLENNGRVINNIKRYITHFFSDKNQNHDPNFIIAIAEAIFNNAGNREQGLAGLDGLAQNIAGAIRGAVIQLLRDRERQENSRDTILNPIIYAYLKSKELRIQQSRARNVKEAIISIIDGIGEAMGSKARKIGFIQHLTQDTEMRQ